MTCRDCGRELTTDEIALTRKLINRGATEHFCFECLARQFKTTVSELKELCDHFRRAGCSLFL